ncbi:hypothetical protein LEMLEM_LOCUS18754 [Lemmus lemmus]
MKLVTLTLSSFTQKGKYLCVLIQSRTG